MNPRDSLVADAFTMHQMEGFILLEEFRIRAEAEKAKEEQQRKCHEVNISFDEVNQHKAPYCLILNDKQYLKEALDIINNISIEEMIALIGFGHLSAEDAGGQYLLAVKDSFYYNAAKNFQDEPDVDYYENPREYSKGRNIHCSLATKDTSDVLDILLSLYGENEAETTLHPHLNITAFADRVMDHIWQLTAEIIEAKILKTH